MMKSKGFTLIELIIVIFIIMIGAIMVLGVAETHGTGTLIERPVCAEFIPITENYMTIN